MSLREQVRALLRDILSGVYAPGERLVEMKIARTLGTSQAPVREALRELEAIGFITSQPHRGAVVGDISGSAASTKSTPCAAAWRSGPPAPLRRRLRGDLSVLQG